MRETLMEAFFHRILDLRMGRSKIMDKYAVEIDPAKVEKEKVGSKGGQPKADPNVNVPLDPEKGTEPYEKEPDDAKKGS